jgi:hypothetical protein
VIQPGSFFHREVVERFGTLDESFHCAMDYEFFLRFAGRVRAEFIPEIVSHFRMHAASKTATVPADFLKEELRAFRRHGAGLLSPFFLDYVRQRFVGPALAVCATPVRRVLRRLLGVPHDGRLRP